MRRVCVVALVLGSLGVAARPAGAKPASPERWDPRVTKYVSFVEQHRKLKFDHPVRVEFLADAAFVKAYQRDDPKITKQDRVEAERIAGELRAVGLIEGPVDLIKSERDLGANDTVGFYDQERKALYVRGTDLTDTDVRVTIVHELTHALQDQHFDLTKLDDAVETEGEDFALTALVEGDATSVEDDYLFSLPQKEQDAYFAGDPTDTVDDTSSSDIPPVLDLFTSGPYVFGSRYVGLLRQAGGQSRVNDAFASPPSTEEEIIDPVAARAGQRGKRVATPSLAAGEQRSGKPDEFGAWSLYLVLASRLDPELSLHAAEGWGGDRYVGFTKRGTDGQECLRISVVGDTRADTGQLADTFSQWAAVLPAGAATSSADRRSRRRHRVRHGFHDRRRRGHARRRRHVARRPQRHRTRARPRPGSSPHRAVRGRPPRGRPCVGRAARRGEVHPRAGGPVHRPGHQGRHHLPHHVTRPPQRAGAGS